MQSEFKAIKRRGVFPFLPHHRLGKTLNAFAFKAPFAPQQLPRWSHWAAPPIPWKRGLKNFHVGSRWWVVPSLLKNFTKNWYHLNIDASLEPPRFLVGKAMSIVVDSLSWNIWIEMNKYVDIHIYTIYILLYLEFQTTSFLWLFQLDDSKSLHKKWLFHQTSIKKMLFRVPGTYIYIHKLAHRLITSHRKKTQRNRKNWGLQAKAANRRRSTVSPSITRSLKRKKNVPVGFVKMVYLDVSKNSGYSKMDGL